MQRYIELAEKARNLREEYEREAAKLDPLRWKMLEAIKAADAEWRRAIYQAQQAQRANHQ